MRHACLIWKNYVNGLPSTIKTNLYPALNLVVLLSINEKGFVLNIELSYTFECFIV